MSAMRHGINRGPLDYIYIYMPLGSWKGEDLCVGHQTNQCMSAMFLKVWVIAQ